MLMWLIPKATYFHYYFHALLFFLTARASLQAQGTQSNEIYAKFLLSPN